MQGQPKQEVSLNLRRHWFLGDGGECVRPREFDRRPNRENHTLTTYYPDDATGADAEAIVCASMVDRLASFVHTAPEDNSRTRD